MYLELMVAGFTQRRVRLYACVALVVTLAMILCLHIPRWLDDVQSPIVRGYSKVVGSTAGSHDSALPGGSHVRSRSLLRSNLLRSDRWWLDQSPAEWFVQCHYATANGITVGAGADEAPATPKFTRRNTYSCLPPDEELPQHLKAAFCARALHLNCRSTSVQAVYQNVVLQASASELLLAVRVSGEQLEAASGTPFLGLLGLVNFRGAGLSNVGTNTSAARVATTRSAFVSLYVDPSRLGARSSDQPLLASARYRVAALLNGDVDSSSLPIIDTITIMAGCQGYVGTVQLSEMHVSAWQGPDSFCVGSPCYPPNATPTDLYTPSDTIPRGHAGLFGAAKPVYLLGEPHASGFDGLRDDLSLVTQVSMDRLGILEHTLDQWDMPVSLVIYAPLKPGKSDDDWQLLYISKKV